MNKKLYESAFVHDGGIKKILAPPPPPMYYPDPRVAEWNLNNPPRPASPPPPRIRLVAKDVVLL